jgi:hypothetical protein
VIIQDGLSDNSESDWGFVKHGVLQGSIQGPLFFLLYISHLPTITEHLNLKANPQTFLFVDDTSIIVSIQTDSILKNNLNSVFNSKMKWFNVNLLSLNADKTYCMEFTLKTLQITKYKSFITI